MPLFFLRYFLNIVIPPIIARRKSTIKMKNRTLAIAAAPAAIPVKPNMPATIAITKKIAAHLSIIVSFYTCISVKNVPQN